MRGEDFALCEELKNLSVNAIIESQNFIREKNDITSVSLSDIKRFIIFYDFFVEYFRKIKKLYEKINYDENVDYFEKFYLSLNKKEIYKNSIQLSLYLCYYLRLSTIELRKEFSYKMNSIFFNNFLYIVEHEKQYIAANVKIKKGIVINEVFLENLFALFSCVNAKVPLFIVGESGYEKNLACQVLNNSMIGESSDNLLFKSLPILLINSCQGSSNTTPKEILNYFSRSKELSEIDYKSDKIKITSMLLFNDIDLVDLSLDNSIKVLHSELDNNLDEDTNKISFVGLSNFVFDFATMNRGITLFTLQYDLKNLEMTAISIANSYDKYIAQEYKDYFFDLAYIYFEYKKKLKEYKFKESFHGLNDFYYLIKTVSRLVLMEKENIISYKIDASSWQKIAFLSIERNFGASLITRELFKEIFKTRYPKFDLKKESNILQRIIYNVKDNESRNIFLIIKSPLLKYLMLSIFNSPEFNKNLVKNLSFYIGSIFKEDIKSERYYNQIFNRILIKMEQNTILVLSDLNRLYPNLINLFKQNFVEIGEKNYLSIKSKDLSDINYSFVNEGFKCIVLFYEKDLDEQSTFLLNTFEKHLISFDNLLEKEFLEQAENIYKLIEEFFIVDLNKKLNIDKKLNISAINWTKEKIQEIIYIKILENEKQGTKLLVQDLFDLFLENYSDILSQDLIFLLKNSELGKKYPEIAEKLINFYRKGEHSNIFNFLTKTKSTKNVIYTFSNIDEPLLTNITNDFETELLGKISKRNIREIQMGLFNSENEFELFLDDIYSEKENDNKIIVFKFNDENKIMINSILYFIENYNREKKDNISHKNQKMFIFLVHMKRILERKRIYRIKEKQKETILFNDSFDEPISNSFDLKQIFIDDLNGEDISFIDIINLKEEKSDNSDIIFNENNKNLLDCEEGKSDINTLLQKNYKEIINQQISMMNFILKNIEYLSMGSIILLLDKTNSIHTFKLLLDKLENFIIKEENLFSSKRKTKSFLLFEKILELKIFDKFNLEELKKIKYANCSFQNKENILRKIKNGEIYFNTFKNIVENFETINIFQEKLRIILFNDEIEVKECMNILNNKFIFITEKILFLQKLILKFNEVNEYKNDIVKIQNLMDLIKSGRMNQIDKPEMKKDLNEIDKLFNQIDLEKMDKYKKSNFFQQIYKKKKMENSIPRKESEYFQQAENDFNKLKLLFTSQKWYKEIQEKLIMDCFKSIKIKKRDNLRNELNILINIFEINEFDDLKMHSLVFGLLSFCQREEILLFAKNVNNLIIELEAEQTDLFKEFIQIRNSLLNQLEYDSIIKIAKLLEYLGFNVIDPDEDDRCYIDLLFNDYYEGSFKFLVNIDDNDIKIFEDLIAKSEDKSINNIDIKEIIKCSNFIRCLGNIKGIKKDQELIKEFINEVQRTKTISESFKNYAKCSEKIIKLFNKK